MRKIRLDLTGRTFGRLTVLRQGEDIVYKNGDHYTAWWCKCSCGNPEEILIRGTYLTSGNTKSCGCLGKSTQFQKKTNKYDLSGEFGKGWTSSGIEFWFDKEDYDKIKDYCWGTPAKDRNYIFAMIPTDIPKKFKAVALHRLIMGVQDIYWKECVVDHINGNVIDNRKSNLRLVDSSQSGMNTGLRSNNTSGVTGVRRTSDGAWIARIDAYGEQHYLGRFQNFEDAVKARKEAEEKYFGEYSYDNSRGIKEGVD